MSKLPPLETEIRRLIAVAGPISIAQYMSLCLTHPVHGYYTTRDPFGARGDFTTAPEVSQMFGELIGLWAAAVWRAMGAPENVRLIELGPGRGTLMRDALRAMQVMPAFRNAVVVHLVEVSPTLREAQRLLLEETGVPIFWHATLEEVPGGPCFIIANEFLDALPIYQAVKQPDGWHARVIGLDVNGNFALGMAPDVIPGFDRLLPAHIRQAATGSIYEWRPDNLALEIGRRVRKNGAALVIDYGHAESAVGDTLQSVGAHAFSDPLSGPGMVDITAHVDFHAFGLAAESMGASVHGPITQAEFLHRLGIEARAAMLKTKASAEQAAAIDAALARLTGAGRTGMGELFKVMALADPKLTPLPAFE